MRFRNWLRSRRARKRSAVAADARRRARSRRARLHARGDRRLGGAGQRGSVSPRARGRPSRSYACRGRRRCPDLRDPDDASNGGACSTSPTTCWCLGTPRRCDSSTAWLTPSPSCSRTHRRYTSGVTRCRTARGADHRSSPGSCVIAASRRSMASRPRSTAIWCARFENAPAGASQHGRKPLNPVASHQGTAMSLAGARWRRVASPRRADSMSSSRPAGLLPRHGGRRRLAHAGSVLGGQQLARERVCVDPEDGWSDAELSHLLGVQACIWTEHVHDEGELHEFLFPRLDAIAERAWTGRIEGGWRSLALRSVRIARHNSP